MLVSVAGGVKPHSANVDTQIGPSSILSISLIHDQNTSRQQPDDTNNDKSGGCSLDSLAAAMFGPFRITSPLSGGLLWKIPWRLSKFQKRRQRERLRAVDGVVATLDAALSRMGQTLPALEQWKAEMPTEPEMLPKDKYTLFDRKAKRYRKGIHSTFSLEEREDSHRSEYKRLFWLTIWLLYRATQVDQSFPENQPSWFLKRRKQRDGTRPSFGGLPRGATALYPDSTILYGITEWFRVYDYAWRSGYPLGGRCVGRKSRAGLDPTQLYIYWRACTTIVHHGINRKRVLELKGFILRPRVSYPLSH